MCIANGNGNGVFKQYYSNNVVYFFFAMGRGEQSKYVEDYFALQMVYAVCRSLKYINVNRARERERTFCLSFLGCRTRVARIHTEMFTSNCHRVATVGALLIRDGRVCG